MWLSRCESCALRPLTTSGLSQNSDSLLPETPILHPRAGSPATLQASVESL